MPRLLLTAAAALMAAVPPALAETALPPAISVVGEAASPCG